MAVILILQDKAIGPTRRNDLVKDLDLSANHADRKRSSKGITEGLVARKKKTPKLRRIIPLPVLDFGRHAVHITVEKKFFDGVDASNDDEGDWCFWRTLPGLAVIYQAIRIQLLVCVLQMMFAYFSLRLAHDTTYG